MTVDFTLDVFMVHENHSAMIPVHVTVFGTVHNATLVLHYGDSEDGPSLNRIINGTSGTQMLQIPTSPQLNCRAPVIQVRVTTNDPLVELEGSSTIFIYIGKYHYLHSCTCIISNLKPQSQQLDLR